MPQSWHRSLREAIPIVAVSPISSPPRLAASSSLAVRPVESARERGTGWCRSDVILRMVPVGDLFTVCREAQDADID